MDREKLVNLLRDAQRKAAQYLANDCEGMYDDISEALSMAESAEIAEPRPGDTMNTQTIIHNMRGTRRIRPQPPRL